MLIKSGGIQTPVIKVVCQKIFLIFCLFINQAQALESIPINPSHLSTVLSEPSGTKLNADVEPTSTGPEKIGFLQLQSQEKIEPHSVLRRRENESTLLRIRGHIRSLYEPIKPFWVDLALYILLAVIALVLVYTVRHYLFTVNRLFGNQRHPYTDIETADWPKVTVFVPAHNEETVIHHSLEALLDSDYPADRLQIIPVNDRSADSTMQIIDDFAARNPGRIRPYHRNEGKPGKAAALKDAERFATGDIFMVFDADYVPGRGLIRQLVAPFFDPEIGAVMGRVVPLNTGTNLLTRLLDLERSGGYQVDQQARMNLHLVPQYGGTVGGVRLEAFRDVGGWRDDSLAEDTDLTYRLLLRGWKTVYQNRSECYEESPEAWPVRVRQIMRWSKGHNQAAFRYAFGLIKSRSVHWTEKLDGTLLLGVYAMSPILLTGWLVAIFLYYFSSNDWLAGTLAIFSLVAYSALGNFAAFFEIGTAVYLDGSNERIRLMPLNYLGFLVSLLSISRATINQITLDLIFRKKFNWQKTSRYRKSLSV